MHIGILVAAAHAAANNSPFTIFNNPRASPSEFVIRFAKYNKAMYTQVSHGMQSRMMFEMEESGVRRYTGTITSTSDLDPVHWKNSQWRNIQVQKRGSVGRTIDVTRYKGYDELQHDLAHMFGIKWLLEDPQRIEWKLVFVDHEYDILHVGDDPWD